MEITFDKLADPRASICLAPEDDSINGWDLPISDIGTSKEFFTPESKLICKYPRKMKGKFKRMTSAWCNTKKINGCKFYLRQMGRWNWNTNTDSKGNSHKCCDDNPGTVIWSFKHTKEEIVTKFRHFGWMERENKCK